MDFKIRISEQSIDIPMDFKRSTGIAMGFKMDVRKDFLGIAMDFKRHVLAIPKHSNWFQEGIS